MVLSQYGPHLRPFDPAAALAVRPRPPAVRPRPPSARASASARPMLCDRVLWADMVEEEEEEDEARRAYLLD